MKPRHWSLRTWSLAQAVLAMVITSAQSTLPKATHDSLWAVWNDEEQADTSRLKAIYNLGWDGYLFSQPDSALHYAHIQATFAERVGSSKYRAAAHNLQGVAHWSVGRFAEALDQFAQGLALQEQAGDRFGMAGTLNNMGSVYKDQARSAEAIESYTRSLGLYEELGDTLGSANPLGNLGSVHQNMGRSDKALQYYLRSLFIVARAGDTHHTAQMLNNVGLVHRVKGDHARAISYFERSLKIHEAIGAGRDMANNLSNIGLVYKDQGDLPKARDHFTRALRIREEREDQYGIAESLSQLATTFQGPGAATRAIEHLEASLKISEEIGDEQGAATTLNDLALVHKNAGDLPHAMDLYTRGLEQCERIGDRLGVTNALINLAEIHGRLGHRVEATRLGARGLVTAQENGAPVQVRDAAQVLHQAYKSAGRTAEALAMHELYMAMRDSVMREENQRELIRHEYRYEFEKKESTLKAEQEKKDAVAREAMRRKDLERNAFIGGFGLMLLLAGTFLVQRNKVSKARARSDELLLNILPSDVADELKAKGEAQARHFETATILFTDFKGFTQASELLSPQELVAELNTCFKAFDGIITARGIEKIKTIGDAYMAAGGLPDPATSSPADVVHAAIEMQAFMQQRKAERDAQGKPVFEMRVGVHTGPVVAGIVGVKKFQYDIWGDTVNTANRMESGGEVGQVNISEATWALVREDASFGFTPRGKVQAKGKGELEMYFVHRR